MEEENKQEFKENVFETLLWTDIKKISFSFLKKNYKRYILPSIIVFLSFAILLAPLTLFEFASRYGIIIYPLAVIIMILLVILLVYPSITSLINLIILDSLIEADGFKKYPKLKSPFKYYISNFYVFYTPMFRRFNKLTLFFLKTIGIYIFLFCVAVVPAIYVKSLGSAGILDEFVRICELWNMGFKNECYQEIINLVPYAKYELIAISIVTFIYAVSSLYGKLFDIAMTDITRFTSVTVFNDKVVISTRTKHAPTFFIYSIFSFGLIAIGYLALQIGVPYGFINLCFSPAFIVGIATSISMLFLLLFIPYIAKQVIEIVDSFEDLYFDTCAGFLDKEYKKFMTSSRFELLKLEFQDDPEKIKEIATNPADNLRRLSVIDMPRRQKFKLLLKRKKN